MRQDIKKRLFFFLFHSFLFQINFQFSCKVQKSKKKKISTSNFKNYYLLFLNYDSYESTPQIDEKLTNSIVFLLIDISAVCNCAYEFGSKHYNFGCEFILKLRISTCKLLDVKLNFAARKDCVDEHFESKSS